MIQHDKELVLLDLCGRLPYGVWVECKMTKCSFAAKQMLNEYDITLIKNDKYDFYKPYLFPLSSMTKEQCYKLSSIRSDFQDCWKYIKTPIPLSICNFEQINWFHKNHFDYRGLIPMGLAIDATRLNIY